MNRYFKSILGILFLTSSLFLTACPDNGAQNIAPYGGYGVTSCLPGQACATSCVPGQPGCPVSGYVHFQGSLAAINNSVAKQMIGAFFGVWNWCLGGCYNYSTIDVVITNGVASVNLNLGGYPIGGQGTITPVNNNAGSDIQVIPFGAGARIDVISNTLPLDGSITNIPSVPVQYNGQVLGTTSLLRQTY